MSGQAVNIGPFKGGLNTFSDSSAIEDDELVVCENFEVDLDGSLKSRPPLLPTTLSIPLQATGQINPLGVYFDSGGVQHLIITDGKSKTYDVTASGVTTVSSTVAFGAMCQYNGLAHLFARPGTSDSGGTWNGTAFVTVANMPKATTAVQQKDRIWTAGDTTNPTRIVYSNLITASTFWPASQNFFEVGKGDGQQIMTLYWYFGNLLIFRDKSVWNFSFSGDPANGVLSVLLPTIGLQDARCLAASESYLYFLYQNRLYEFLNNRAFQANIKVPFQGDFSAGLNMPLSVSEFNKRIVVNFYGTTYVYGRNTKTWTTWSSTLTDMAIFYPKFDVAYNPISSWVLGAQNGSGSTPIYQMQDGFSVTDSESFTCKMTTKNFSYSNPARFKRLFWWGVDSVFHGIMRTQVQQITQTFSSTWGRVRTQNWSYFLNHTWGHLFDSAPIVEDTVDTSGQAISRRLVKVQHPLRFRQVAFHVEFDTDGTTLTGPARLFGLTSFVLEHEKVVDQIS